MPIYCNDIKLKHIGSIAPEGNRLQNGRQFFVPKLMLMPHTDYDLRSQAII